VETVQGRRRRRKAGAGGKEKEKEGEGGGRSSACVLSRRRKKWRAVYSSSRPRQS
jgi:hypothetical protein